MKKSGILYGTRPLHQESRIMSNILIVDDDSATRKLLQVLISRFDHNIFMAENLQEALALVEEHPIDIVFLDVILPDGNGLEALPAIKQKPSSP